MLLCYDATNMAEYCPDVMLWYGLKQCVLTPSSPPLPDMNYSSYCRNSLCKEYEMYKFQCIVVCRNKLNVCWMCDVQLCFLSAAQERMFSCGSLSGKWFCSFEEACGESQLSHTIWRQKHCACGTLRFIPFRRAASIRHCAQHIIQSTLKEAHSQTSTPTATEIEQNVVMGRRFVCS